MCRFLVPKARKPAVLRPHDAWMLSRGFEVPPYRSRGIFRGNNPESRVDRLGRWMGAGERAVAVSSNCCHPARRRSERASDASSRLEKGQYLSLARKIHR